jgi:hypothetical protein
VIADRRRLQIGPSAAIHRGLAVLEMFFIGLLSHSPG